MSDIDPKVMKLKVTNNEKFSKGINVKKILVKGLVLTVGASVALGVTGCGGGNASAGEANTIKVGRLLPLTGPLAGTGNRVADGSEIARQIINEKGGINGTTVEFSTVDAPDDEGARKGAERLINEDVDIVLGTFGSSLALAAIPVVTREGGLYWETGASAVAITNGEYQNVFRVSDTAGDIGAGAMEFAAEDVAERLGKEAGDLSVGWAGVSNSYGEDVKNGVITKANEYGMDIVLDAAYPLGSADLSSVAKQIGDANPDVLVLTSYDADAAALGRAMRAADITPPVIIGSGGGHINKSWIESMGDSGNGFFNVGFSSTLNTEGLSDSAKSYYDEFVTRYKAAHDGQEPGAFDMNGFAGAMALFETMKSADGFSSEAIAKAAQSMDVAERGNADGTGLKFNENGQNERGLMMVSQWQDGETVPVYPADLALAEPASVPLPEWDEKR